MIRNPIKFSKGACQQRQASLFCGQTRGLYLVEKNGGMHDVQQILAHVRSWNAAMIVVSKTHPVSRIREIYDLGIRDFGENKVQEMIEKAPQLPRDIRWHLIGHLQTNKVKYVAPFVFMIHTVDSEKLLGEIEKQAAKHDRSIRVLFQFHVAREESKFGIDPNQMDWLTQVDFPLEYPHLIPSGVMGMATFTDDEDIIRREFQQLHSIFHQLKTSVFADQASFKDISMGMSSDYAIALEEGSTMVRIGSLLFGAREVPPQ